MTSSFSDKSSAELEGSPPPAEGGDTAAPNPVGGMLDDLSPFDAESVNHFKDGAGQVKDMASNGGFAINEDGMKHYIKMCDTFLDGYPEQIQNAWRLAERAKLGSSPFAYQMADFNVKVATDPETGLIPNLEKMKEGFVLLREAFVIARSNYDENESHNDQYFRAVDLGE